MITFLYKSHTKNRRGTGGIMQYSKPRQIKTMTTICERRRDIRLTRLQARAKEDIAAHGYIKPATIRAEVEANYEALQKCKLKDLQGAMDTLACCFLCTGAEAEHASRDTPSTYERVTWTDLGNRLRALFPEPFLMRAVKQWQQQLLLRAHRTMQLSPFAKQYYFIRCKNV